MRETPDLVGMTFCCFCGEPDVMLTRILTHQKKQDAL